MLLEDPNITMRPDFTLPKHKAVRQQLIDDRLTNEQAAQQRHLCEMRLREEEEEEKQQQCCKEEEDAAWLEERKKNKNKYMPVMCGKVPSNPTILPAQYTLRKLKSSDYYKLHYFTNCGLKDTKISTLVAEPDAMVMLPVSDGLHSWVPTAAVKDPKAAPITKEEHLTWKEFNEAAPHMITMMRMHNWPND
ncbi:hypothetical protein EDD22DRAFT_958239 [Suillus occidentalis]|nr:hypothetical protein EDD22DRAFT_958239 [Suillus occidentalis]